MYSFYASALLEPILDSVVIKIFIYNLYAFISWYVLWYLDDSVVYMRDLILAHIWLLGLNLYKSGVTLLQPFLHGDNEVLALEKHEHARVPFFSMVDHLQPGGIDETHKRPLPGAPTVGVLDRRLVNLCLRV
jgi:hypothetical protein